MTIFHSARTCWVRCVKFSTILPMRKLPFSLLDLWEIIYMFVIFVTTLILLIHPNMKLAEGFDYYLPPAACMRQSVRPSVRHVFA